MRPHRSLATVHPSQGSVVSLEYGPVNCQIVQLVRASLPPRSHWFLYHSANQSHPDFLHPALSHFRTKPDTHPFRCRPTWEPLSAPRSANSNVLDNASVHSSWGRYTKGDDTLPPELGKPKLGSDEEFERAPLSLQQPNPQFDNRLYPSKSSNHLDIRVAPNLPIMTQATATQRFRDGTLKPPTSR